jgi:hypothetical protein
MIRTKPTEPAYPWRTPIKMLQCGACSKLLIYLAPRAGFEPATNRLTAGCCEISPRNDVTHLVAQNALFINTYLEKRVTCRQLSKHGDTAKNVVTGLSRRHRLRIIIAGKGPKRLIWRHV